MELGYVFAKVLCINFDGLTLSSISVFPGYTLDGSNDDMGEIAKTCTPPFSLDFLNRRNLSGTKDLIVW